MLVIPLGVVQASAPSPILPGFRARPTNRCCPQMLLPRSPLNETPTRGDIMQVQVNTDDNIEGRDALTAQVEADIRDGLSRFAGQITRVEVHLSDENAGKGGNDKRCLLEVRPTGQQPVAVTQQSGTLQEATAGAVQKMQRKLQSTFGRQNKAKGGHSIRDLDAL